MPTPIYLPKQENKTGDMVTQMLMQMFTMKFQQGLESTAAEAAQKQAEIALGKERAYKEGEWNRQKIVTERMKIAADERGKEEERRQKRLENPFEKAIAADDKLSTQETRAPGSVPVSKERFMSDDRKTGLPAYTKRLPYKMTIGGKEVMVQMDEDGQLRQVSSGQSGPLATITTPDGTQVQVGGGVPGLSKPTETAVQKDVIGLMEQAKNLDVLKDTVMKDAFTLQGQVKGKLVRLADWVKYPLSKSNKEFLGRTRHTIESVEQIFNTYRKEITGAQAAMKEISMLRDSIINRKLTPTELEYSLSRYTNQIKRTLRLKRMLLNQGVLGKKLGTEIDKLFVTGDDVPDIEIDRYGDELKAKGMNDNEIMSVLEAEGYI